MKVLELKTKKQIEVNESYGARLIEHGMAILPPVISRVPVQKSEKTAVKKGDA